MHHLEPARLVRRRIHAHRRLGQLQSPDRPLSQLRGRYLRRRRRRRPDRNDNEARAAVCTHVLPQLSRRRTRIVRADLLRVLAIRRRLRCTTPSPPPPPRGPITMMVWTRPPSSPPTTGPSSACAGDAETAIRRAAASPASLSICPTRSVPLSPRATPRPRPCQPPTTA